MHCRHLLLGQMREQYPAQGCAIGRQPAADSECDRHNPLRSRARYVDDSTVVENGNRRGLAKRLAHLFEYRLRRNGNRGGRKICVAEIENSRLEEIRAAVGRRIPELTQGVETTPYNRAGEAGGGGGTSAASSRSTRR